MRNFICKVFAIFLLMAQSTLGFAAYIPDGKYSEGDSTPSPLKGSALVGDDSGTLSALDIIAGRAQVDAAVSSLPLPSGAATEAKQDDAITQLTSIAGEDFATETTLATLNAKVTTVDTGNVNVASSALPSGASTEAKQPALGTAGTASADVITVQGIASMTPLDVNVLSGGGGGTEYSVANTPPADPVGGTLLFEDTGSAWQSVGVGAGDGKPLPVGIYDDAGAQMGTAGNPLNVTGAGGGTQYAEGDALGSTPTGTLLIGRKFSDDTAEGVTVGTASTKRPIHVQTIDANGDIRPPATLYQQSDTSNTADLAPGIAWKDADGTGNWHVTSIDDPLPIQIATSSYFPSQLTDSGNFKSSVDEYSNASVTSSGAVCTMTGIGGASTALIEVTGTFTASIIPQVSVDNGSNYTSIGLLKGAWTLYDIHRGTYHYEINRPGIYQVNISGANAFRLNCAAYTSGTATVRAAVTSAPTAFKSKVNTQNAAINITSGSGSGNKTIISAVVGYKIRVTGFWFMSNTATTVQFKDGSGGSVLSGPLAVPVTGGIVVPKTADGDCVIETDGSSNTAMVLVIGTAANVGGTVYYTLVEA